MWRKNLRNALGCRVEEGKEIASLSALGVGGRAEFFAEPSDIGDVREIFRLRQGMGFPLYILGGGTNVVFADGVLEGVVLSARRMSAARWEDEELLTAEAGCPLSLVVSGAAERELTGAEFARGIPGTVGGAVAGNAGAGGRSVGELLEEVTTVENDGGVRRWGRGDFGYSYRRCSLFPGRFLAGCRMRFRRASREEIERNEETFRRARAGQPQGVKSAGCVFKNPPEDSAGRLLDVSGCKGLRVGGAAVSEAHANFIFNADRAAGEDVRKLMELCRDTVFRKTGVLLEPEIKFLGFSL
ncbi:MAG: UDP-N-acetylmuramate dehydrogenase [Synergistaceae bacterium]|jgi:UDP-N-acetylmuramate dehydrogenase|nr:UDP-N-acetylmuramate dehydrogenase [Synergistaceae bacterium]